MSEFDFLHDSLPVGGGAETARAFVIRAMPDLFARETLNVGVCVVALSGERIARSITQTGRLSCLYDEIGARLVVEMAGRAAERFKKGLPSENPQISFVEIGPIYNISPQEAIGSLFHDLVTVATMTRKEHDARTADQADVLAEEDWVAQVQGVLRLRHPLDADQIIPSNPSIRIASDKGDFDVPVHVTGLNRFGRIVAASQSPQTVQKKLIFALADMERLAEEKGARVALFIGRSNQDIKTDVMVDYVYQRKTRAVVIEAEYTPEALAGNIDGWLKAA